MRSEQERLAREWAESKLAMPTGHLDADVLAAAEHILATTTKPTMADVEWDEEKHALTGAVVDVGGGPVQVVMLVGSVDGIDYVTLDGKFGYEPRYYFTPNGKKYRLVEVTADEHPETLETLEDYENAPQGTIVALADSPPWSKTPSGGWRQAGDYRTSPEMVGVKRKMLRWGWGE